MFQFCWPANYELGAVVRCIQPTLTRTPTSTDQYRDVEILLDRVLNNQFHLVRSLISG